MDAVVSGISDVQHLIGGIDEEIPRATQLIQPGAGGRCGAENRFTGAIPSPRPTYRQRIDTSIDFSSDNSQEEVAAVVPTDGDGDDDVPFRMMSFEFFEVNQRRRMIVKTNPRRRTPKRNPSHQIEQSDRHVHRPFLGGRGTDLGV